MNSRLIYDVGMHRGEDTDFYLKRGHCVVGIEANPTLVAELRARFKAEISAGQLRIVDKAINSHAGMARFAINQMNSVWGTLRDEFISRNDALGSPSTFIEVECLTFGQILREYGMPYYLKIDIEGCDLLCLEALNGFDDRPRYVSIETVATSPRRGVAETLAEIRLLRRLGYKRFQYVDQAPIADSTHHFSIEGNSLTYTFPAESSGPFGAELPGRWRTFGVTALRGVSLRLIDDFWGHGGWLTKLAGASRSRKLRRRLTGQASHWYDLHAAID
jgi:FkbM family methyltransferase